MSESLLKPFDIKRSVKEIRKRGYSEKSKVTLAIGGKKYEWSNPIERVSTIRSGFPYEVLEDIADKLNWPIKDVLEIIGIPQTTYNKKKKEKAIMDTHESELALMIVELLDFGFEVFNHEKEKFQRWFLKPNLSFEGNTPKSFLDTFSGIQEIKSCLQRVEFGIYA